MSLEDSLVRFRIQSFSIKPLLNCKLYFELKMVNNYQKPMKQNSHPTEGADSQVRRWVSTVQNRLFFFSVDLSNKSETWLRFVNLFFVIYPRISFESQIKSCIEMWCVIIMFVRSFIAVLFTDSDQQCLRFAGRGNSEEETYLQEVYLPRSWSWSTSWYAQVSKLASRPAR